MKSTGEVLGIAPTREEALFKGMVAAGIKIIRPKNNKEGESLPLGCTSSQPTPSSGDTPRNAPSAPDGVLFSVKQMDLRELPALAQKFYKLGFKLYGTSGNADTIERSGLPVTRVNKVHENYNDNIITLLDSGTIAYVISTSAKGRNPDAESVKFRRHAVERDIECLTALDTANALADCLATDFTEDNTSLVDITKLDSKVNILEKLQGTREEEILNQMKDLYSKIQKSQAEWYEKSNFTCPQGCGECCRNFEPDLLDCEADFMAAWLLDNQPEIAEKITQGIFPFPENKGCPFWNEEAEYHCTIYGGRSFICRFFGAASFKSKDGSLAFKPCKFYPDEKLSAFKIPLSHRQYNEKEIQEIFGIKPPLMSDIMESAISLNPDNHTTKVIREILPAAIKRIKWLCSMTEGE